ncbi:MAG: GIY-YIG nuclease family protein [Phycisphaerae bacterium]|nr:GIY-YIG nuclease family protein [Phycisphaerae bacterium]
MTDLSATIALVLEVAERRVPGTFGVNTILASLPERPAYIYFIRSENLGRTKIGVTNNHERRLVQLSKYNAIGRTAGDLRIVGLIAFAEGSRAYELEGQLHRMLRMKLGRSTCSEWYRTSTASLARIVAMLLEDETCAGAYSPWSRFAGAGPLDFTG